MSPSIAPRIVLQLPLDLRGPRLGRVLVEGFQPVAGDQHDDGVVAKLPVAASFDQHGDRGAAGGLGEQALGRGEQVDPGKDLGVLQANAAVPPRLCTASMTR